MTEAPADLATTYDKVRSYVGKSYRVEVGVLDALQAQRFAVATDDLNPIYFDSEAAGHAGYPGLAVPPLYLTGVLNWGSGPAESELLSDGNAREPVGEVPVDGLRLMGGGQQLRWSKPPVVGMRVTMETVVRDVTLKRGKRGDLMLLEFLRTFTDQDGDVLVECTETFIGR